jgi:hypothetical protein
MKQPKHISIGNWNVKSCLLAKFCCLGSLEYETFQGSCLRQALAKACNYKQWVRKFVMACTWCFNQIWTSWSPKVYNLAEKDKHEPVIINTSSSFANYFIKSFSVASLSLLYVHWHLKRHSGIKGKYTDINRNNTNPTGSFAWISQNLLIAHNLH